MPAAGRACVVVVGLPDDRSARPSRNSPFPRPSGGGRRGGAGVFRAAGRALLLPAGGALRLLLHPRRRQPDLAGPDRAQPRPHRRPQRHRAGRNYSAYTLEITPSRVADLEQTIEALSKRRHPAQGPQAPQEADGRIKNFESLPIRNRLTDEEVARFIAQRYRFPGVEVKARLFRDYPMGAFGSHIIGYIGRINDRDLERIEENDDRSQLPGTDHIGKAGLEKSYERELHGQTGYEEVEVDSGGRAVCGPCGARRPRRATTWC